MPERELSQQRDCLVVRISGHTEELWMLSRDFRPARCSGRCRFHAEFPPNGLLINLPALIRGEELNQQDHILKLAWSSFSASSTMDSICAGVGSAAPRTDLIPPGSD